MTPPGRLTAVGSKSLVVSGTQHDRCSIIDTMGRGRVHERSDSSPPLGLVAYLGLD
jgi:hypothetical protein